MVDSLKSEILDALYSVGISEIKDKFELLIKQYGSFDPGPYLEHMIENGFFADTGIPWSTFQLLLKKSESIPKPIHNLVLNLYKSKSFGSNLYSTHGLNAAWFMPFKEVEHDFNLLSNFNLSNRGDLKSALLVGAWLNKLKKEGFSEEDYSYARVLYEYDSITRNISAKQHDILHKLVINEMLRSPEFVLSQMNADFLKQIFLDNGQDEVTINFITSNQDIPVFKQLNISTKTPAFFELINKIKNRDTKEGYNLMLRIIREELPADIGFITDLVESRGLSILKMDSHPYNQAICSLIIVYAAYYPDKNIYEETSIKDFMSAYYNPLKEGIDMNALESDYPLVFDRLKYISILTHVDTLRYLFDDSLKTALSEKLAESEVSLKNFDL